MFDSHHNNDNDRGVTSEKLSDTYSLDVHQTVSKSTKKKTGRQLEKERVLSALDAEDQHIKANPSFFKNTESSSEEDFAHLLETKYNREFSPGDVITGTIIDIQKDFVLVDIKYKSEGLIPINEFQSTNEEAKSKDIVVGSQLEVYIEHLENENGMVVLSKSKADLLKAWQDIAKIAETQDIIKGTVTEKVKGGLSVDIGVKAFLPGSQIDLRPIKNLDEFVGKTLEFKIIKFNKKRGNIVLSRRALLEEDQNQLKMKNQAPENLKNGDVVVGVVKNITDYGAFIGLGGLDGLLHITDMSWKRIKHPSEILEVGGKIEVKVLRYDGENSRVSLGLKQMHPDPWAGVRDSFPTGSKIQGRIVSLADYGAFVELKDGVEGLIHVSEMSWTKRIKHPSECVSVNDVVDVMVLDVDSDHRRISLGIKQLKQNPWEELKKVYEPGAIIEGYIKSVTDFGIFIGVEDNIDGLVHISDFSWTKRVHHPSEMFKKGDKVRAVVLGLDVEHERFSLGIKQLEPDPWENIEETFSVGSQYEVTVVKIAEFGAFVKLTANMEGLIHVSEIPKERNEKISDHFKVGDKLKAVIVNIDKKARKIALSAKLSSKTQDKGVGTSHVKVGKPDVKSSGTSFGEIFGETLKQAADSQADDTKSIKKNAKDVKTTPTKDKDKKEKITEPKNTPTATQETESKNS